MDKVPGRATWHAFSFGEFYDPERTRCGPIVCLDEHLLGNGQGFSEHHHQGVEILTYVVAGALEHRDSLGNVATLAAGELGWLRSGTGVEHAEIATAPATRFVQVWLDAPARSRVDAPAWSRVELNDTGDPVVVLPGGTLRVLRLTAGAEATVAGASGPDTIVHLHVAAGALTRHSLAEPLAAGDALVIDGDEATQDRTVSAAIDSVLLVWTLPSAPAPVSQ